MDDGPPPAPEGARVAWVVPEGFVVLHRRDRPSRGERENPVPGRIEQFLILGQEARLALRPDHAPHRPLRFSVPLHVARRNVRRHAARVDLVQCDLASAISARFDLIVANPPYIPLHEIPSLQREVRDHEPHIALAGGETGVEYYRRIVPEAERLLKPGGWLIVEIGYQGEKEVRAAFGAAWTDLATEYDLAGWPRVIRARYAP